MLKNERRDIAKRLSDTCVLCVLTEREKKEKTEVHDFHHTENIKGIHVYGIHQLAKS